MMVYSKAQDLDIAFFPEDRVKKYCNSKIFLSNETDTTHISSQGFIHNPGYPRFYSGLLKCNWRITVPFQQHIELTILDLSILGKKNSPPEIFLYFIGRFDLI